MLRVVGSVILLLLSSLALAQSPTVLSGPQSQEGSVLTPQAMQHVDPPDPTWSAERLEARADELRSQKLYADAIDYYQAATKKDARRPMLWNKLGIAEYQFMRYEDAKKDYQRALKIDKKFPEAMNNLAVIYYAEQHYGKAIKLYRKAIDIRSDAASFHSNLANAYFSNKDFEKASQEYLRAVELDPDILERHSSGGVQARVAGPQDRARYSYYVARLYARTGNFERALNYLRRAIEDGYPQVNNVYKDQEFAELRKDPRFTELMSAKPQTITQ